MKSIKKIKFVAPSKLSMTSKDEFMTKIKPVLGQNQINLASFVNDFNAKTRPLSDTNVIELSTHLLKKPDKSFIVVTNLPGVGILKNQFAVEDRQLAIRYLQDILRLKILFEEKVSSKTTVNAPRVARTLLSNLKAFGIQIKT